MKEREKDEEGEMREEERGETRTRRERAVQNKRGR